MSKIYDFPPKPFGLLLLQIDPNQDYRVETSLGPQGGEKGAARGGGGPALHEIWSNDVKSHLGTTKKRRDVPGVLRRRWETGGDKAHKNAVKGSVFFFVTRL